MSNEFDNFEGLIRAEELLANYDGEDRIITFKEVYEATQHQNDTELAFKSHLGALDEALGGFELGELVVVSGITGQGKSLLCQTFTSNLEKEGVHSLWFTFEMPPKNFVRRFPNLPLAYMPAIHRSNTLEWLEQRIIEAKVKFGIKAVFVDHLHFLVSLSMRGNASLEIGAVVRELKLMALRHNVVFFLIAHMTKIKFDTEPELGSIRDSSFIEQEADSVIYIWRKANTPNLSMLKIAKNRKRGLVNQKIELKYENGSLTEMTDVLQEELKLL